MTERTTLEAAALQAELLDRGVPADHQDALIAASAREHGATFATGERHFWREEVRSMLDVAAYGSGSNGTDPDTHLGGTYAERT